MANLAYPDLVAINIVRKASKTGVALLAGATVLLSSLASEPAHAKNGRGLAIGVGAFGVGVLLSDAYRAEKYSNSNDDDDYQERSYRKKSPPPSPRNRSSSAEVQFSQEVLETQKSLNQAGYNAGTADGVGGPQTTAAVKAFQRGFGYQETGRLTAEQRKKLYVIAPQMANADDDGGAQQVHATGNFAPEATRSEPRSDTPKFGTETPQQETKTVAGHENTAQIVPEAEIETSTLQVEKALFSLQLTKSLPDGKIDDETVAAIKQLQSRFNQSPTGELTSEQRAHLMTLVRAYFSFEKN